MNILIVPGSKKTKRSDRKDERSDLTQDYMKNSVDSTSVPWDWQAFSHNKWHPEGFIVFKFIPSV